MKAPSVRSLGPIGSGTGTTLTLPVGANSPGDLAIAYIKGNALAANNSGPGPTIPGFADVYRVITTDEYTVMMWRKVPAAGLGGAVTVYAGLGQVVADGWYGHVDVISGAGFPAYGWLDVPGAAGSYGTYSRSALSTGTWNLVDIMVRVRLKTVGVNQYFAGWGAVGDMAVGLTAGNYMHAYVVNTLAAQIGNQPSSIPLPLQADRPVWLRYQIHRDTGQQTYYYSYVDLGYASAVYSHWIQLGTTVAGVGAGTTIRTSNSGTILLGTYHASVVPNFDGDLLSYREESDSGPVVTADINFSDPQPGVVEVGSADVVYPTTEDGPDTPIEYFVYDTMPMNPEFVYAAGAEVQTPDSLIYRLFALDRTEASVTGYVHDLPGHQSYGDRTALVINRGVRQQVFTKVASVDQPSFGVYEGDPLTEVSFAVLVIRGTTEIVLPPAQPQSERIQLGCADSYTLFITDGSYDRTIEQVGWSRLRWERVLDDISKASATIPDRYGGVSCLAQVGGMVPWAYGIKIERNDQEVWRGPVTNVSRSGTDIQVDAADLLVRYQKRFLGRGLTVEYSEVDAGTLFRNVIAVHAALASDAWSLPVPDVHTGVSITRALHPRELKYAWDLLSELLDSAVDAYVMNGRLYVYEPRAGWQYQDVSKRTLAGPYNTNYDFVYGMFTESAWAERPNWSMDGPGQANYVAVPGIDSSEFGFRRIQVVENTVSQARYGVLDYVDQDRLELPEDTHVKIEAEAMQRRADTLIALRAFSPAVVSGGALSAEAPIDMENLRPGSLWKVDIWDHGFGQLLTAGRVSRITVDVTAEQSGIKEVVVPTLMPPGWEDVGG